MSFGQHCQESFALSKTTPTYKLRTLLGALAILGFLGACGVEPGVEEDDLQIDESVSELGSGPSVSSFVTSTGCSTAVVIGLSKQIANEIRCMSPGSLTQFSASNGITITDNAVLPFLAPDAKDDLIDVGNTHINSAFRTIAQQYLLRQWFFRGICGIADAAPVGQSNHESGRAVDLANADARAMAMAKHHWTRLSGDPVHFDHLRSDDIRGKDIRAFQRLWNRNHPGDKIAADGIYGHETAKRLKKSPARGFTTGATCMPRTRVAEVVGVDGPDRVAPGQKAHYAITLINDTDVDWSETTRLRMADGNASELYDQSSWASNVEIGTIEQAIPAGSMGTVEFDLITPLVTNRTPIATQLALVDGATQMGIVDFALTITVDGDENTSGDGSDQTDDATTGGCSVGGSAGWLSLVVVLLVIRRRQH